MKIYLGVCCLNRVFERTARTRMFRERTAIETIYESPAAIVTSEVVRQEISATSDAELRTALEALDDEASHRVVVTTQIVNRGAELERLGFHAIDALRLACAEAAAVDAFITTDDRLLRAAQRQSARLKVRVENPTSWPL